MPTLTLTVAATFAFANFLASLSFENASVVLVCGSVPDRNSDETDHVLWDLVAVSILGASCSGEHLHYVTSAALPNRKVFNGFSSYMRPLARRERVLLRPLLSALRPGKRTGSVVARRSCQFISSIARSMSLTIPLACEPRGQARARHGKGLKPSGISFTTKPAKPAATPRLQCSQGA